MKQSYIIDVLAQPAKHPRSFIIFTVIVFGLLTTGISNLVFTSLGKLLESKFNLSEEWWSIIVVIVCFTAIAIGLSNLPNWINELKRGLITEISVDSNIQILDDANAEETLPGLVVAMSKPAGERPTVAQRSIAHHWLKGKGKLNHCWLICTNLTIQYVGEIVEKLDSEGIPVRCVTQNEPQEEAGTRCIYLYFGADYHLENPSGFTPRSSDTSLSLLVSDEDADDPNEIRRLIEAIYLDVQAKNIRESDVIVDYTGGTKSFTAGIVLAGAGANRRLQYISQIKDKIIEVITSYHLKPVKNR
jgi:hypothetical protein